MEKIRVGIVGAGNIARTHLAAYKNVADAEIVAIQLASAQFSYEAALMATSKITQTSLLNYL